MTPKQFLKEWDRQKEQPKLVGEWKEDNRRYGPDKRPVAVVYQLGVGLWEWAILETPDTQRITSSRFQTAQEARDLCDKNLVVRGYQIWQRTDPIEEKELYPVITKAERLRRRHA